MSIKNIRSLGFAKGTLHKGANLDSFMNILKAGLTELDIFWTDQCCSTTAPPGTGGGGSGGSGSQIFFDDSDCIQILGSGLEVDPYIAYPIISDAGDNVLQCTEDGLYVAAADLGLSITADNGLRMSTASNVQLGNPTAPGRPLLQTSYVDAGNFQLIINGSIPNSTAKGTFKVENTSVASVLDAAIYGVAAAGRGVEGLSTTGPGVLGTGNWGVYGISSGSVALYGQASGGANGLHVESADAVTGQIVRSAATNSTILTVLEIGRQTTSGSFGANNIGGAIDLQVETDSGASQVSNRIIWKWATAANVTRGSQFELWGVNSGTLFEQVRVDSAGNITGFGTGIGVTALLGTTGGYFGGSICGVLGQAPNTPIQANNTSSVNNTIVSGIQISRQGTYNGAAGAGISIRWDVKNSAGATLHTGAIRHKLTSTTAASETSQYEFELRDTGVATVPVVFTGGGIVSIGAGLTPSIASRLEVQDDTLAGKAMVYLVTNSTQAAANAQKGLHISMTGVNANASQITYGAYIDNAHTGTTALSYGLYANGVSYGVFGDNTAGTPGIGVYGRTTSGTALYAQATSSGTGAHIEAVSGDGATVSSVSGLPLSAITFSTSASAIVEILRIHRAVGAGSASNGVGGSINYQIEDSSNFATFAGSLSVSYTDITTGTRDSKFEMILVNNGANTSVVTVSSAGLLTLPQGAPEYADNAAAVSAGLAVGTFYRTGDAAKIVH